MCDRDRATPLREAQAAHADPKLRSGFDPAWADLIDSTWWPGWLDPDDWAKVEGRWWALVGDGGRWSRYQTGPAENRIGGFDQDHIRRADCIAGTPHRQAPPVGLSERVEARACGPESFRGEIRDRGQSLYQSSRPSE